MSFSKVAEQLMEGYMKIPMSLEQRALENVALRICHNCKLKQHIFFIQLKTSDSPSAKQLRLKWEESILKESTEVCKTLFLTHKIQERLIVLIRKISLQLLFWSGVWKGLFDISCNLTADIWMLTDWADGRLDERKIAKHIVLDEKISNYQRYRLSCVYCLEESISHLWNQLSLKERASLIRDDYGFPKYKVIKLWSKYMQNPNFPKNDNFFLNLLHKALYESLISKAAVVFAWNKLSSVTKEKLLEINCNIEEYIVDNDDDVASHENERDNNHIDHNEDRNNNDNEDDDNNDHSDDMLFRYFITTVVFHRKVEPLKYLYPFMDDFIIWLPHPFGYLDAICFLLLQFRKFRVASFQKLAKSCESVIKSFLNWPPTDFTTAESCLKNYSTDNETINIFFS
ncbi:uncharacterized protein LOC118204041 [Stegodyphus dumicola]|uniref:uncharacterized protein LOC118204041 n=1 Tax=Stegodyphus dumicola TaxID=202533 RepID=UPI0015A8D265|nr:uncharacterized protein LOC118204041 [Stegodyphus dumicola]